MPTTTTPAGPTNGVAMLYASAGDDEFPWTPVGWWAAGAWTAAAEGTAQPPATFTELSVIATELPGGARRHVTGFEPRPMECAGSEEPSIVVDSGLVASDSWGFRAIAVTADWDVQPRPVEVLAAAAELGDVQMAELVPPGMGADPSLGAVSQRIRADLDGDGSQEELITFEHHTATDMGAASGDFAVIALRRQRPDGSSTLEPLLAEVIESPIDVIDPDVIAVADLNGDGVMEVVVAATHWEGLSVRVFDVRDGTPVQALLSGSCAG
jgi:hypothetical protein